MTVVAHLSDVHLDLSDVRAHRFTAVLAQVAKLSAVDALIISGDITDNGAPEEYEQFLSMLPATLPTLVVLGNHDLAAPASAALSHAGRGPELNTSLTVDELTMVGLDSHTDHRAEGNLDEEALAFARNAIAAAPGPVVLVMHHPPVPMGHAVMDDIGLCNPEALRDLVSGQTQVVGVLTGHFHTALATTFTGTPLLGAPGIASTMRLESTALPLADPDAMPGLALHTIEGTLIRTIFHYLSPSEL